MTCHPSLLRTAFSIQLWSSPAALIAHGHGEHFFGLNAVVDKFPKAGRLRAAAAGATACRAGDARVDADLEQLP